MRCVAEWLSAPPMREAEPCTRGMEVRCMFRVHEERDDDRLAKTEKESSSYLCSGVEEGFRGWGDRMING
jgi:hypothetical protein